MKLNKNNHLGVYVNNIGEAEDYITLRFLVLNLYLGRMKKLVSRMETSFFTS